MLCSRATFLWILLLLAEACYAQQPVARGLDLSAQAVSGPDLPARFLGRMQRKLTGLDDQLTKQTQKYLERMARREAKLQKKLYKVDSAGAKSLFAGSAQQYAALSQKLATDTGILHLHLSGEYQAYTDSLQGMLQYLKANPGSLNTAELQHSLQQLQALQAKLQDADQAKAYIKQRQQQLSQYIQQHANLAGLLGKDYQAWNQEAYYYGQQVRAYKEMLNDPDKWEKQALAILGKVPAFQSFMQQNSQLAGLFNLPGGNASAPQALAGLQTRDQVGGLISQQVAAAGSAGIPSIQGNIQAAQSKFNSYKDKLLQAGGGNSNQDAPDFRPNGQKTKTFWRRVEYGANFQTTKNNYFPTTTDFGLSAGYRLTDRSTLSVGASYKLSWGSDIQHIAIRSSGVGVRVMNLDVKIKGGFSATAGYEYNYATPFKGVQQLRQWSRWSKSGFVGVAKTVSMKSRVFKKTRVAVLWDFLSYQQVPRTQAVLMRLGYAF
ncbi:MAG: hypothetical protein J0H07_16955 [Sphingobacteriales bacterium]|nr:hypothetical protein [Sphingobacteriales bacterium]